jgi:4-amino-4-deoxy-L-arabinose transferase-like glycosyltransferase
MQNHKWRRDSLLLLGLIGLSLALRLWKIEGYMVFLGDEGRDVLVARHILQGKLTLLGPTTSVGGFYLGPVYYYFIAPMLWLFRDNPVGPAVLVALFQAATVALIYWFSREFLDWRVGAAAGLIYALSPLTIKYGRSSWNPNPLPFFSLLVVALMVLAVKRLSWRPALLAGVAWGIALQLHYLALILGPIAAILALLEVNPRRIGQRWLAFLTGGLLGLAPFLLFELRHGFPNLKTIWHFLVGQGDRPVAPRSPIRLVGDANALGRRLGTWFMGFQFEDTAQVLVSLATAFLFLSVLTVLVRRRHDSRGLLALTVWWTVGFLGLSLYQGQIYDYYFAFLFPAFALVVGNFFGRLLSWFPVNLFALGGLAYLLGQMFSALPLRQAPNFQVEQTSSIARDLLNRAGGRAFNFALLSGGNSDHAYRYFFEVWGRAPVPLERKVTPQLMVVCEESNCPVLGSPLWEIAGFGRARITGVWQARGGTKIIRLGHHPDSEALVGKPAPKG